MNTIKKPWGEEWIWAETAQYIAKILWIDEGASLSLQYHQLKEETLYVQSGTGLLLVGEHPEKLTQKNFKPGDSFHFYPKTIHQLEAVTRCQIFEVSTPHLNDVVRLRDRYGRI